MMNNEATQRQMRLAELLQEHWFRKPINMISEAVLQKDTNFHMLLEAFKMIRHHTGNARDHEIDRYHKYDIYINDRYTWQITATEDKDSNLVATLSTEQDAYTLVRDNLLDTWQNWPWHSMSPDSIVQMLPLFDMFWADSKLMDDFIKHVSQWAIVDVSVEMVGEFKAVTNVSLTYKSKNTVTASADGIYDQYVKYTVYGEHAAGDGSTEGMWRVTVDASITETPTPVANDGVMQIDLVELSCRRADIGTYKNPITRYIVDMAKHDVLEIAHSDVPDHVDNMQALQIVTAYMHAAARLLNGNIPLRVWLPELVDAPVRARVIGDAVILNLPEHPQVLARVNPVRDADAELWRIYVDIVHNDVWTRCL